MLLRSKFLISMALLASAAIVTFPSCGYDGCADIPVLTSISATSVSAGGPGFTLTPTGRHLHLDTIFFFEAAS